MNTKSKAVAALLLEDFCNDADYDDFEDENDEAIEIFERDMLNTISLAITHNDSAEFDAQFHQITENLSNKFVGNTVKVFGDDEFRENFRMERRTFVKILNRMRANASDFTEERLNEMSTNLLVFLWYLGSSDSLKKISSLFRLETQTIQNIIRHVSKTISNDFTKVITWPNENEQEQISSGFEAQYSIPNCTGVVDIIEFDLNGCILGDASYMNMKGCPSILLQVGTIDELFKILIIHEITQYIMYYTGNKIL